MDPYMCGDDLILPKITFKDEDNPALNFINQFKPPGLENTFIEVDDTGANGPADPCWNAPAFSSGAWSSRLGAGGFAALALATAIGVLGSVLGSTRV